MDNNACFQEGSGSRNELHMEDVKFTEKAKEPCWKWSLTCLCVLLFIIVVVFVTLFSIFYIKAENESPKECTSKNCVRTAAMMLEKMDQDADPCEDFTQYACGHFYRDTVIPENAAYVDMFTRMKSKNFRVMRVMLQEIIKPADQDYVKKMKNLYQMCMDVDSIEKTGLKSYLDSPHPKEWPTLNPDWDSMAFDLNGLVVKFESLFSHNFFSYQIGADMVASSKNVLKVRQPSLCLESLGKMKGSRNSSELLACQRYYEDVAIALGASGTTARADAEALVDFQVKLAKISVPEDVTANKSILYNPTTLGQMSKDYPSIDWQRTFSSIFNTIGLSIHENMTVINEHPTYFASLGKLLKSTDNRVIQNRYAFNYANSVVKDLTEQMRAASLKLKKVTKGVKKQFPRWRQCLENVEKSFPAGMAKQFVDKALPKESISYIERMIHFVKDAFRQQLEDSAWMGPKTKEAAYKKLESIKYTIGHPKDNFRDQDIDLLYNNMTVWKGDFYKTHLEISRQRAISNLKKITKSVDFSNWRENVMAINAQNVFEANEARFYAGFLQPNLFSESFPSSVNYGAIGQVIGHEITHFFDMEGRQYDERGNLRNWWQPVDLGRFVQRSQCLIDQYAAFEVPEIAANVDGNLTIGETTADNGGITTAYMSYKKYSASQTTEHPLPALGLNIDQQFFLSFAQMHCSLHTKEDLGYMVHSSRHPLGKFRILGTLRNSETFASVFNCPVGSGMNPTKKCVVW